MNAQEIAQELENRVKALLPESFVSIKFTSHLYPLITVRFAKSKTWMNGIIQNDPFFTMMFIEGFTEQGEAYPKQKLEIRSINRSYPLRGKTAEAEKLIAYLEKYFVGVKNFLDKP